MNEQLSSDSDLEKVKKRKEYRKKYYQKNRERIRAQEKERSQKKREENEEEYRARSRSQAEKRKANNEPPRRPRVRTLQDNPDYEKIVKAMQQEARKKEKNGK